MNGMMVQSTGRGPCGAIFKQTSVISGFGGFGNFGGMGSGSDDVVANIKKTAGELRAIAERLLPLRKKNMMLSQQNSEVAMQKMREDLTNKEIHVKALEQALSEEKKKAASFVQKIETLARDTHMMTDKIKQLEGFQDKINKLVVDCESRTETANQRLAVLAERRVSVEQMATKAATDAEHMVHEITALAEINEGLKRKTDENAKVIADMREKLEKASREISSREAEVMQLKVNFEALTVKHDEAVSGKADAEDRLTGLKASLAEAEMTAATRAADAEAAVKDFSKKLAEAQGEAAAEREKAAALTQQSADFRTASIARESELTADLLAAKDAAKREAEAAAKCKQDLEVSTTAALAAKSLSDRNDKEMEKQMAKQEAALKEATKKEQAKAMEEIEKREMSWQREMAAARAESDARVATAEASLKAAATSAVDTAITVETLRSQLAAAEAATSRAREQLAAMVKSRDDAEATRKSITEKPQQLKHLDVQLFSNHHTAAAVQATETAPTLAVGAGPEPSIAQKPAPLPAWPEPEASSWMTPSQLPPSQKQLSSVAPLALSALLVPEATKAAEAKKTDQNKTAKSQQAPPSVKQAPPPPSITPAPPPSTFSRMRPASQKTVGGSKGVVAKKTTVPTGRAVRGGGRARVLMLGDGGEVPPSEEQNEDWGATTMSMEFDF